MVAKAITPLLTFQIIFITIIQVSTQNVDIQTEGAGENQTNEVEGKEQLHEDNDGNTQLTVDDGSNKQSNKEDGDNQQLKEEEGGDEHFDEEDGHNPQFNAHIVDTDTTEEETVEDIRNFKIYKTALWNVASDKLDEKLEPGFNLTTAEMDKFKIWKNGVIPYYIDVTSFKDNMLRDFIRKSLSLMGTATRLNFDELPTPPKNDEERWVFFTNRRGLRGCADHSVKNFTNKGVQQVVLGYECVTRGELAEAVMSIVGVPAQHNAPDRDNYIQVNMENIMPDKRHLFEKLGDTDWLFHDLEYDYNSITHYDIHKYSLKGHATIQLKRGDVNFNPAKLFSPTDLLKIKMLYNYITGHRKLQVPKCQKLFKTNRFERFVPERNPIQPRKKPDRYLGLIDNNRANDDGYTLGQVHGHQEQKVHSEEIEAQDEENEVKIKSGEETDKIKHVPKKSVISSDSDLDKRTQLKASILKFPEMDLLTHFSDYQTDDDRDRKKKLNLIKSNTLKGRVDMKFTNTGSSRHAYGMEDIIGEKEER